MDNNLKWFKSSYSGQPSTDCVELAFLANTTVYVRDSKATDGPRHKFKAQAWDAFVRAMKDETVCAR